MAEDTLKDQKLEIKHRDKSNIMMEVKSGILQESQKEI